jgi:hypothetical protein
MSLWVRMRGIRVGVRSYKVQDFCLSRQTGWVFFGGEGPTLLESSVRRHPIPSQDPPFR